MVFRTCHVKTCNRLRTIPHVYICIGCFTLCLLSLSMEIDRGRSFAQERLCWQLRAVTAGVSIYKVVVLDGDQYCMHLVGLIRDDCKKNKKQQQRNSFDKWRLHENQSCAIPSMTPDPILNTWCSPHIFALQHFHDSHEYLGACCLVSAGCSLCMFVRM